MTDKEQIALSRRGLLQTSAAALLARVVVADPALSQEYSPHPAKRIGQPQEGPDTPKITTGMNDLLDDTEATRLKQIGINWVSNATAPEQPWGIDYLQPRVEALAKHDMRVGIIMIRWSNQGALDPNMSKIVFGLPGRDGEISKIKETIANCGKLGIPVVEYNFYNHRASDGYARVLARGGATSNEFKYDRMRDLPATPGEVTQTY